ncbi:MAG: NUDIX domain-containing protein [Acidobacteriota bacterium]|nr:NUDIX domain-containing protein [Acidobacteriota bacterium]
MFKSLLGALWRHSPKSLKRWGVRLVEPRFTVTAGAVVLDERGRVLLLEHRFRAENNAWGIPGGFIEKGEQPEEALRRELREEVGLELAEAEIAFARTLGKAKQVEIIFRCRPSGGVGRKNAEIKSAEWFELDKLPRGFTKDQRRLIERALEDRAKAPD